MIGSLSEIESFRSPNKDNSEESCHCIKQFSKTIEQNGF